MIRLVDVVIGIERSLAEAGLPHGFGGALALAYFVDEPRGTRDVDVNVFVPPGEVATVLAALPPEVRWGERDRTTLERDGQVRLLWEDEIPVDLFLSTDAFHDEAAARTVLVPFAGIELPVLDATTLAVFKALFDRTRDWADIEAMVEVGSIDAHRTQRWVDDLLGPDDHRARRLATALAGAAGPAA